jgi:hypothetical protein
LIAAQCRIGFGSLPSKNDKNRWERDIQSLR